MGNCYRLKDKCLFVDFRAYDGTHWQPRNQQPPVPPVGGPPGEITPDAITQLAHILDQRPPGPPTWVPLNDTAAFITRLIVMGVDVDLIPELLKSEYSEQQIGSFKTQVTDLVKDLQPYIEVRQPNDRRGSQPHGNEPPKILAKKTFPHKGYNLDFSVNWFGTGGCCKIPC
jgi:hypothetical protein